MWRVVHSEAYLPDPVVKKFDTLDDVKNYYQSNSDLIDFYARDLKVGESVEFDYDFYVSLTLQRLP